MNTLPAGFRFLMKKLGVPPSPRNRLATIITGFFLLVLSTPVIAQGQYSSFEKIDAFCNQSTPQFSVDYVSRLEESFGIEGRKKTMYRLNALFSDVYDSFTLHPERSKKEALDTLNLSNIHALAIAHADNHHFDSSLFYVRQALELDTSNTRTYYVYGVVMEKKRKEKEGN